ncbi:actin cortical patch SUR7/pH-response regulator PalI family protein [Pseudohyphozyma bogoriensis]|nr:actin cortical patch SUR7/pH-response regulator PalI family protein [Pseudohyphozyma bogoriensis]
MRITKSSVRLPSFFGPFALAAGLMIVGCFSEPFWQNFYVIQANSLNVTMKAGAWGVCNRLRNNTGVTGPSTWCTSKSSGYTLNFVLNSTGVNQFPTIADDATLFGTNGDSSSTVSIFTSGQTGVFWLHPISAIVATLTVVSLAIPPSYLGPETSALHRFQKGGMLTIVLGVLAAILALVTFIADMAVIVPAKGRLNDIDGISASWGNIQWFALPSAIVMFVGLISVLTLTPPGWKMMSPSRNEYADL